MATVQQIILANKCADKAIREKNIEMASIYLKIIHKLEIQDGIDIGDYRLKRINNEM